MAIDRHTARFLVACRASGVRFDRTATLGRQNLYLSVKDVRDLLAEYHVNAAADEQLLARGGAFADGFFEILGANELTSIDASSFEGATWIHDMNNPIPPDWRERFDVVFDGGTLEHVFHFPTALKNAMEMVKIGGHLLIQTPANNFCGHGFYQFSPELFFRVLADENGFEMDRMIAVENFTGGRWYQVVDPAAVRSRIELAASNHRVLLLISARRTHRLEVLMRPPQQSDYVLSWNQNLPHDVRYEFGKGAVRSALPRAIASSLSLIRRGALAATARWGGAAARWADSREAVAQNRRLSFTSQPVFFRPVDK